METFAPWPQLNPEFWRGLGLTASIENFKMKNTLWSTKTHSTQKYDTQHWPTRLKQTRQLRPEDWSKSPSKSLVWLGFSPWLAIQSHGQFCSSRIQTFTKGLCFICCEADYHLISGYKKNFQPLKVPFHRVSVLNVIINYCAENLLATTSLL